LNSKPQTAEDVWSQVTNLKILKYLGQKVENQCLKVQSYSPKATSANRLMEAFALSLLTTEIGNCQISGFDSLRDSILAEFSSNPESFAKKDLKETIKNYNVLAQIFAAKDFPGSSFVEKLEQ
jgi:hypothetical protein